LIGLDRKWLAKGQNGALTQPDIDFHAQTRYAEVTLGVQSDRGEPERSVTGAIKCAAAGNLASPAFSQAATLLGSSSGGRNGDELACVEAGESV
jgi:hypothetical protein